MHANVETTQRYYRRPCSGINQCASGYLVPQQITSVCCDLLIVSFINQCVLEDLLSMFHEVLDDDALIANVVHILLGRFGQ